MSESVERASERRRAIERQPDLSQMQARELDRIMDRDVMGLPEAQTKDLSAVNWLVHSGLVRRQGSAFVATEDGARAYVKHVKAGRPL